MPLTATAASLAEVLDEMTAEGASELTEHLAGNALKCYACGHRCLIKEGKRGICKVRFNEGGHLRVPVNYVAALACDPTEKKPFFHCLPGSDTLTFGMLGCDLHCAYCQNWLTSQALRDDAAVSPPNVVTADRLVAMAKAYGASMVGSSYNEPLITAEWAVEVFRKARPEGFRTAFISNGNATPQVLDYLRPWTDCYKIDLKSMSDRNYRQLGGVVDNILDTVKMVHERGFWEEIVTLVIPGFTDSEDELKRAAGFIPPRRAGGVRSIRRYARVSVEARDKGCGLSRNHSIDEARTMNCAGAEASRPGERAGRRARTAQWAAFTFSGVAGAGR